MVLSLALSVGMGGRCGLRCRLLPGGLFADTKKRRHRQQTDCSSLLLMAALPVDPLLGRTMFWQQDLCQSRLVRKGPRNPRKRWGFVVPAFPAAGVRFQELRRSGAN